MKKLEKELYEKRFKKKWNEFINKEHCVYRGGRVRYIRKKDNLLVLKIVGLDKYLQIYLEDNGQIDKLIKVLKKDDYVKVNEDSK